MNEENFNRFLLGFIPLSPPSPFSISFYADRITSGKRRDVDVEESKVNLKLFRLSSANFRPKENTV